MAYASGKFAVALCDRCGFKYKLHTLKEEWNGLKTCRECYEPKHPQLTPHTAPADPQAIYKPRPDTDKEVGEGFVITNNDNIIGSPIPGYRMEGELGTIAVSGDVDTPTPTPAPTPAPTPSPSPNIYTVTVQNYIR